VNCQAFGDRARKGAFILTAEGWRYKCWKAKCAFVEPGTGWEPLEIGTIAIDAAGGPAPFRQMLVRKNRDRAVVLYWYAIHGRMLANEIASKVWLLHDSLWFRRSDAALVRIVVPVGTADAIAAEQRGLTFAHGVLPYLLQLWS